MYDVTVIPNSTCLWRVFISPLDLDWLNGLIRHLDQNWKEQTCRNQTNEKA
jgi:hypothetical protein